MPPKRERLIKKDFSLLSHKKIIRGSLFDLGYLKSEKIKVGCVISKKILKRAVDRNKLKRKIYNSFSLCKPVKPYIYLFYPKREALYTSNLELKNKISEIFAKL